ncbi:lipopolysaccharide biosynthesis protein [Pseudorhodobacter sp.]|uniref:lipopolysaccharide biosynthesis protein n=1 Tax=Pseudorhodobacter sp. TaxID=1934400 RepID=UPI002649583E|nr:oligosaccharide flippase family protein [Pseudorhodobacter sp.]MDN5788083.1 oligosaccharide flippase family protein [Pseudorhodobacter sp.]
MSQNNRLLAWQTIGVTLGRIVLLGFWFVAVIWSYRQIGAQPDGIAQAGFLALALAGLKLFSSALSDPLDTDVLRQVPRFLASDPQRAVAVWRSAQQLRIAISAILICAAALLARPIAAQFMGDATQAPLVILAGIAAALEILFRGHLADCQSRNRFTRFLTYEAALQVLRITGLVVAALWFGLNAKTFLTAYAIATFALLIVAYLGTSPDRRAVWRVDVPVMRDSMTYLRWVAPAMLLSAVVERLDLFLLTSLRGAAEAGLYGALLPLLLVPEVVAGFATHALQPRISEMQGGGEFIPFWTGLLKFTIPLAVVAILGVFFLAEPLISLTIGPAFLAAAPVLRVLATAVLLWVGLVPVALALVVMSRPRVTLGITLVQACVIGTIGMALIPAHGALGAAWAVLAMRVIAGAMICAAALLGARKAVPA